MNVRKGALALAVALLASGRGRRSPGRRRYLILWGGKEGLARALREYGVKTELRSYTTIVKGRRYTRTVIIVRDPQATEEASMLLANPRRLARLASMNPEVVGVVLYSIKRMHGWRDVVDVLPRATLYKILGIKPFNYSLYKLWRHRRIATAVKPNWRAWFYVMKLKRANAGG